MSYRRCPSRCRPSSRRLRPCLRSSANVCQTLPVLFCPLECLEGENTQSFTGHAGTPVGRTSRSPRHLGATRTRNFRKIGRTRQVWRTRLTSNSIECFKSVAERIDPGAFATTQIAKRIMTLVYLARHSWVTYWRSIFGLWRADEAGNKRRRPVLVNERDLSLFNRLRSHGCVYNEQDIRVGNSWALRIDKKPNEEEKSPFGELHRNLDQNELGRTKKHSAGF